MFFFFKKTELLEKLIYCKIQIYVCVCVGGGVSVITKNSICRIYLILFLYIIWVKIMRLKLKKKHKRISGKLEEHWFNWLRLYFITLSIRLSVNLALFTDKKFKQE